jgi:hypothetical protein
VALGSAGGVPPTHPDPRLTPEEAAEIQALFDEARRILMSPGFKSNLIAAAAGLDLRLEPNGAGVDPAELAQMLRSEHSRFSYVSTKVRWRDLFWGSETEPSERPPPAAVIKLKKSVRGSWRSEGALEKSCAINTAAHELTHTISETPGKVDFTIADGGYGGAAKKGQHFASYTVGSVAQCTWLQERRAMPGSLAECVRSHGTQGYTCGAP